MNWSWRDESSSSSSICDESFVGKLCAHKLMKYCRRNIVDDAAEFSEYILVACEQVEEEER